MFSKFEFIMEMIALFSSIFLGVIIGCIWHHKAQEKKKLGPFAYKFYIGLPTFLGMGVGFLLMWLLDRVFS